MGEHPSRQTLELVPGRAITFSIGVAKYPAIAAVLGQKGYNQAENDYAWQRLSKLGALPSVGGTAGVSDQQVSDAVIELDAWDEPNFGIIRAVTNRFYPKLIDVIFKDLEPKQGPEAVLSVATMLDRLDELAASTDPDAGPLLKLLSDRSYTKVERTRLRGLVEMVTTFTPVTLVTDAERVQILTELYDWITDWSTTAHALIKRRQHLIALGVATPRKSKKAKKGKKAPEEEETSAEEGGGAAGAGNGSAGAGNGTISLGP